MLGSDAINQLADLPTCIVIEDFPGFKVAVHNILNGMIVALPAKAHGLSLTQKLAEDLAIIIPVHEIVEVGKPAKTQYINYIHGNDINKLVAAWKSQAAQIEF